MIRVCSYCFLFVLVLIGCASPAPENKENTSHLRVDTAAPFYHGVASGDPHSESVILWTRITPKKQVQEVMVKWEIASDREFKDIVNQGQESTSPLKDYTVKVEADGLKPGSKYYYRFHGLKGTSRIGTTKTAAADNSNINLAVVSCSNVEFGYFNAYSAIAKESELDAVLHLGDYIYEYGPNVYGDSAFYRKNIPPHEIISLQDYRDRYSQYRLDPDLQAAHAAHPFINIWDDHEITNNAYIDGAQNHQENEGSYETRKSVAKQVFYEWLPIREGDVHYRNFSYGNMMDLYMLDERLAGRTAQPDSLSDPRIDAMDHTMLGAQQLDWLTSGLSESNARWKVIGNQVIFSFTDWGYDGFTVNLDAWDGYPGEQFKLASTLRDNAIENVIFVTGDTHTAWAFESTNNPFEDYDPKTGDGAVAIEFGVSSVSSGNSNERFPDSLVIAHEKKISNSSVNPHLKYVNMRDHGYLVLHLNEEKASAEFKIVSTLKSRDYELAVDRSFDVLAGTTQLVSK